MNSGRSSRQSESGSEYSFVKAPKRKRLAKACDACHKSKRRCDGTSPCGNCYYTSKTCTYTDAAGRTVPAPRDKPGPTTAGVEGGGLGESWSNTAASSSSAVNNIVGAEESTTSSKRRRASPADDPETAGTEDVVLSPAPGTHLGDRSGSPRRLLDPSLTWELVNLFFTHCNPYLLFIHRPTFFQALSTGTLPQYLLYAVCALGAPISRRPRLRTEPSRMAGKDFGQEALSLMFDGAGRLICPRNLETVQALCLIRVHTVRLRAYDPKYHELALQMLRTLGMYDQVDEDNLPSKMALERECLRRVFWHMYCTNLRDAMYARMPLMFREADSDLLTMRMPIDESAFQFALRSLPPPEYLQSAPPSSQPSEFAHFIRIVKLKNNIEHILNPQIGRDPEADPFSALGACERGVMAWESALPEGLRYNEDNRQVHVSMLETSASTIAWLFFAMHLHHSSSALALNCAKQTTLRDSRWEPRWAESRIENILDLLGGRAKHTYILPVSIWSLRRYCNVDSSRLHDLLAQTEDVWGINPIAQTEDTPLCPPSQLLPPSQGATAFSPSPLPSSTPLRYPHPTADPQSQLSHPSSSSIYTLPSRPPPPPIHPHSHNNPSSRGILSTSGTHPHAHLYHLPTHDPPSPQQNEVSDSANQSLSLPSLKASGLLNLDVDSWHTGRPGGPAMMPLSVNPNDPQEGEYGGVQRGVGEGGGSFGLYANGLPVGMPWLANEGR